MAKIAFLGLGAMGVRMAAHLLAAGHQLSLWNRSPGKAAELAAQGAVFAASPRAAAEGADFVISMVRDDEASRAVWTSPLTGALGGMRLDALAVECSTLSLTWVRRLGSIAADAGIGFVDAPVAGSRPQAEARSLIFFAGGSAASVERLGPVLLAMGASVNHAGPVGAGMAVKLAVNSLLAVQSGLMAELLETLRRQGFDPAQGLSAIAAAPACAPAARTAGELMLKDAFAPMFPIELVAKDLDYALAAAGDARLAPLLCAARDLYAQAAQTELGAEHLTALVKNYRPRAANMFRLQDRLDAFRANFEANIAPPDVVALMHRTTDDLRASGLAARARQIGDRAPGFALVDTDGNRVDSSALLARGPLVVTFYRGVWCPYCNLELKALEEAAPAIRALGAEIIAISPQTQANCRKAELDNRLSFRVLSDPGLAAAAGFGLPFRLPDDLAALYRGFGVDLAQVNDGAPQSLPMPARYVIGRDGVIVYAEINPDYTRRPDPSEMMPALERAGMAQAM